MVLLSITKPVINSLMNSKTSTKDLLDKVRSEALRIGENRAVRDMIDFDIEASTAVLLVKGQYRSSGKWLAPKLEKVLAVWSQAS